MRESDPEYPTGNLPPRLRSSRTAADQPFRKIMPLKNPAAITCRNTSPSTSYGTKDQERSWSTSRPHPRSIVTNLEGAAEHPSPLFLGQGEMLTVSRDFQRNTQTCQNEDANGEKQAKSSSRLPTNLHDQTGQHDVRSLPLSDRERAGYASSYRQ